MSDIIDKMISELESSEDSSVEEKVEPYKIEDLKEKFMRLHLLSNYMCRNRRRPTFQALFGINFVRKAYLKTFKLAPEEREVYEEVTEYTTTKYKFAQQINDKAKGFIMVIFQKMLTSSMFALYNSLQNRKGKLKNMLDEKAKSSMKKQEDKPNSEEIIEEIKESSEIENKVEEIYTLENFYTEDEIKEEIEVLDRLIEKIKNFENFEETKVKELKKILEEIFSKDPKEKVLIFTQFLNTQEYLNGILSKNYKVTIFNGKMNKNEKDEAVDNFKKSAQIMISTDAGGEGRNFQFCHILINYDLPWNPMKIEQRIGRLDRIGQKRDVEIYNFAVEDTIEGRIIEVLQERIHLFEEIIGLLDPVLGEVEEELTEIQMMQDKEKLERWSEDIELKIRKTKETEEKLEDLVLDLKSFKQNLVENILKEYNVKNRKKEDISKNFFFEFFNRYYSSPSFKIENLNDGRYSITLPDAFLEDIKQIEKEPISKHWLITFDKNIAKEFESVDYFTFGHPLFDRIIQYCKTEYFVRNNNPIFFGYVGGVFIKNFPIKNTSGVLFNYYLEIETPIYKTERFLPIFITISGEYEPEFTEIFFERINSNDVSIMDLNKEDLGIFIENIDKLRDVADKCATRILKEEEVNFTQKNNENYLRRKEKIDTLYRFKIDGERKRRKDVEIRLQSIEKEGTEEQKKIIPALKGRITESEKREKMIEEEWKKKIDELNKDKESLQKRNLRLVNLICIKTE